MRPAEAGNAQQNENTMLFSNNKLSAVLREDHPNCQKFAVSSVPVIGGHPTHTRDQEKGGIFGQSRCNQ